MTGNNPWTKVSKTKYGS